MKTTIYMVRHAESPFIFGQELKRGLSEKGSLDANKITGIMANEHIDVVVSSPYKRALHTVEGIAKAKGLVVHEYDELKERPIKGLDYKASEPELMEGIKKSFEDKNYCLIGGESTKEAQERAVPIIRKLLDEYQGKKIVIGTHGNIMTIIMNYYKEEYGFEFWMNTSKPDIYRLVFEDGKLVEVERIWR